MLRCNSRRAPLLAGAFALLLLARPLAAQQYVTESVGDLERGACEVALWHGERSTWAQPACHLLPNVELRAGVGSVVSRVGERSTHLLLEGKWILRPLRPGSNGLALVAGLVRHPESEAVPGGFTDLFAFVPLSASLPGDRVRVHLNVGWHYDREDDGIGYLPSEEPEAHHNVFAAAKLNVRLSERITAIGELYADHPIMPGYQLGVRAEVLPERLQLDLSYGWHADRRDWGRGLTAGVLLVAPVRR